MKTVDRPSPNFNDRPGGRAPDMLVLHYTGMETATAALDRLCDPAAQVSAHYTVDEDGTVYRHVAEDKRAWHAGVACWRGERDVNGASVGIEIVNPGHEFGYRPFPKAQMAAVLDLCGGVLARHPIPARNVVGHSDVAPARKTDPGELFDWAWLAANGVGLWPESQPGNQPPSSGLLIGPGQSGGAVVDLQIALDAFGYEIEGTGLFDAATETVVSAFQRHFRPGQVDGTADGQTLELLHAVLDLADAASGGMN